MLSILSLPKSSLEAKFDDFKTCQKVVFSLSSPFPAEPRYTLPFLKKPTDPDLHFLTFSEFLSTIWVKESDWLTITELEVSVAS